MGGGNGEGRVSGVTDTAGAGRSWVGVPPSSDLGGGWVVLMVGGEMDVEGKGFEKETETENGRAVLVVCYTRQLLNPSALLQPLLKNLLR